MSDQVSKESGADSNPIKLDMGAAAAPKAPEPSKPEPPAAPSPQQTLPLGLGLKDSKEPAPIAAPAPAPEVVAAPAPSPAPSADPALKVKPAKPRKTDAAAITEEVKALREEHERLLSSVNEGRTLQRLQVLRRAGVEGLTDEQLMILAPKVDPGSTAGAEEIGRWLADNQALVSPRFRTRPSAAPSIIEKSAKSEGLLRVFGDSETLARNVKNMLEEG